MNRIFAFGNALRVFVFIKEAAKFWLYIPEERKESICNDQSQMSSINEVNKTTSCLGEALLNAIRLAVREEITEALIQGRFSFDDRLLNTEEASKVLQVSPDWLYRNSRKLPFTRKVGAKALRFFYRGIQTLIRRDVGLVLQGWYLEWRPIFPDNRERVLHLRRKRPATKGFPFCSVKETLIEDCGTIKARPQSPTLK